MDNLNLQHFTCNVSEQKIAHVVLNVPEQTMNVLNRQTMDEIDSVLDCLYEQSEIVGVLIYSGKENSCIAGADVHMLDACANAAEASELAERGQTLFNRIESFRVPVAIAIHGVCLGGGIELALACHYRICSDDAKTQLGLPEIKLGLIPGSGGTQRLPRLINLQSALDVMLTGKQLRAKQAYKLGLVDDLVPVSILLKTAEACLLSGFPKQRVVKRNVLGKLLETSTLGRGILFDQALKAINKKTQGNYPAPHRLIDAVRVGLDNGKRIGLNHEAKLFGELKETPQSQQLRNVFFATVDNKRVGEQFNVDNLPTIKRTAVLGGGLMGGGIAYITADKANLPVRLKDINHHGIRHALKYGYTLWSQKVKRRFMSSVERDKKMLRVSGTTDYSGFKSVDIVVEAVFEDLDLKQQMVTDIELHCQPSTVFATNTSSIPITQIAEHAQRPENIIGLHYFSPVDKMPLVEIITHAKTSNETVAKTLAFARKQGKTPIVVKDGAGFYVNRILALYINEAMQLLMSGEPIDVVDNILVKFGFPVGPFKLLDEVGIDIGTKILPILVEQLGSRFTPPESLSLITQDERKGKKNKRGFYQYRGHRLQKILKQKIGQAVDPSIYSVLGITAQHDKGADEIIERCTLHMLNEAARCLEEGIITSPLDGDIGAIFGIGFPPFLGGPFRYMDSLGAEHIVERLAHYQAVHGVRFTPCPLLHDMAKTGERFYPS